jgi:uncharacterized protein (UPF0262 family)
MCVHAGLVTAAAITRACARIPAWASAAKPPPRTAAVVISTARGLLFSHNRTLTKNLCSHIISKRRFGDCCRDYVTICKYLTNSPTVMTDSPTVKISIPPVTTNSPTVTTNSPTLTTISPTATTNSPTVTRGNRFSCVGKCDEAPIGKGCGCDLDCERSAAYTRTHPGTHTHTHTHTHTEYLFLHTVNTRRFGDCCRDYVRICKYAYNAGR